MIARSRFIAPMPAALRSTTTKQFDCWIRSRSRFDVGGSRYSLRRIVYQPACWFSTSDTVPSGDAQRCRSLLALADASPAAAPVATVFDSALPMRMFVVSQPASSSAAARAPRTAGAEEEREGKRKAVVGMEGTTGKEWQSL
ncbi:hypothetical protein ACAN107058_20500 [Paracidovorax anthurii]